MSKCVTKKYVIKKTSLIICFILSFGFTNHTFSQLLKDSIIGKWQLIRKSGGKTGKTIFGDPKVKTVIEFAPDSIYKIYRGDSLITKRTYHFIKSTSIYNRRDSVYLIKISKSFMNKKSFRVYENTLVLKDECYDCYTSIYRRVQPIIKE